MKYYRNQLVSCVREDVLPLLMFGYNWQSLQEVPYHIAMCRCNKSISGSKRKTTD